MRIELFGYFVEFRPRNSEVVTTEGLGTHLSGRIHPVVTLEEASSAAIDLVTDGDRKRIKRGLSINDCERTPVMKISERNDNLMFLGDPYNTNLLFANDNNRDVLGKSISLAMSRIDENSGNDGQVSCHFLRLPRRRAYQGGEYSPAEVQDFFQNIFRVTPDAFEECSDKEAQILESEFSIRCPGYQQRGVNRNSHFYIKINVDPFKRLTFMEPQLPIELGQSGMEPFISPRSPHLSAQK